MGKLMVFDTATGICKPEFIFRIRDSIKIFFLKRLIPSYHAKAGKIAVDAVKVCMSLDVAAYFSSCTPQLFKFFLCGIVKDSFNVFRSIHNLYLYTHFPHLSSHFMEAAWT